MSSKHPEHELTDAERTKLAQPLRVRWHVLVCYTWKQLDDALAEGWEPYAVTSEGHHWVRRKTVTTSGGSVVVSP